MTVAGAPTEGAAARAAVRVMVMTAVVAAATATHGRRRRKQCQPYANHAGHATVAVRAVARAAPDKVRRTMNERAGACMGSGEGEDASSGKRMEARGAARAIGEGAW